MTTTGCTPVKDLALNHLVVCQGTVTKNLCVSGVATIQKFDVQASVFASVSANVANLQSSGGQVGNLVSLQIAFDLLAPLLVGSGVVIGVLGPGQAPFGNITGVAISSTFEGGTLLVDSTGTVYLYATSINLPAGTYTGSLTYLV